VRFLAAAIHVFAIVVKFIQQKDRVTKPKALETILENKLLSSELREATAILIDSHTPSIDPMPTNPDPILLELHILHI
jgi:hypothetical protein